MKLAPFVDSSDGSGRTTPADTVAQARITAAIAKMEIRQFRWSRLVALFIAFFGFSAWRIVSSIRPVEGEGGRGSRYTFLEYPETYDAVYAVYGFMSYTFHVNSFVFLVPLLGLVLGYGAVVTPRATGQLKTVLAFPCSRAAILIGTLLGRGIILTAVIGTGLLVGWITILVQFETAQAGFYAAFSAATIGYGFVWLSIGFALSSLFATPRRVAAAVFTVFIGFTFNWHEIAVNALGLFPDAYSVDPRQAYLILASAPYEEIIPKVHLAPHEDIDGFGTTVVGTQIAEVAAVPLHLSWPVAVCVLGLWIFVPLVITYNRLRRLSLT
ncbi:ABC transporter permease [Natronobacterium texcoconense]|nr:ABC transporter permease subunit [Natronobacterium texcoconense]